jgi:Transcriptional regulator, AbiEi antitoxin, Type IV TA system/Transcriptional regulator, AbiEi antitoxin N-terminal domain
MITANPTKINQLLLNTPIDAVLLSSWLVSNGYSYELQNQYKKNSWLVSIGNGAVARKNVQLRYENGLHALQQQAKMDIHIGGKTALHLLGRMHYLQFRNLSVTLFANQFTKLPVWFTTYNWGVKINFHPSNFIPSSLAIVDYDFNNFTLKISNALRALLECIYLAKSEEALIECFEILENLNDLQPKQVQQLLEKCTSIKVKRYFIYMAEKINHPWFNKLNVNKIDLGKGKRVLLKDGVWIKKHGITVPQYLEKNAEE